MARMLPRHSRAVFHRSVELGLLLVPGVNVR